MKFKIGDEVKVDHPKMGSWSGKVLSARICVGGSGVEYLVENAPIFYNEYCLAW